MIRVATEDLLDGVVEETLRLDDLFDCHDASLSGLGASAYRESGSDVGAGDLDGACSAIVLMGSEERPPSGASPPHFPEMASSSVCQSGWLEGTMSSAKYHQKYPPTYRG